MTLDYPLLKDISEYTGIDKIFEFIKAIGLEQKFLKLFPAGYVINILSRITGIGKNQWIIYVK